MAADNLIYQGIDRAVSDYTGARACEELVNLRPTEGGVAPVKGFSVKMSDVSLSRVFVHHTTGGDRYIGIWTDGEAVKVYLLDDGGDPDTELFDTPYRHSGTAGSINVATAGNVLLISMCDRYAEEYHTKAWIWKDGSYVEMEADDPGVSFTVSSESLVTAVQEVPYQTEAYDEAQLTEYLGSALNAAQETDPSLCLGPVVIAVALKARDGSTFRTGLWTVYDPAKKVDASGETRVDGDTPDMPSFFDDFFTKYGYGYMVGINNDGPNRDRIYVEGTRVTLSFPAVAGWDEDTSVIQSVEVYASRPVLYLDTDRAYEGYDPDSRICVIPRRKYGDMDLGGQILYHQASIQMSALSKGAQTVVLSFGGSVQLTEDALDTDAGAVVRYGRVLSYNARFHYFDSVSHIDVGTPSFLYSASGTAANAYVFARYADSERSELLYLGTTSGYLGAADVVVAPTLNVKEVLVYAQGNSASQRVIHTYRMQASSSYNFSICAGGPTSSNTITGTATDLEALISRGVKGITSEEPDAINVTEQYNPFVFLVEHSYKAPGNIIDVQPQMAGIADASYGRDPLSVFTERGTYALTQGSANVLYGAFIPVSATVIYGGGGTVVPTDMGVFYLGDGALWLLAGRRSALVSDALTLGPHKYIRSCTGYKKLCGTDTHFSATPAPENPFYDVSPYLSQVEFKDFAAGGKVGFNRFRMEIFVSNPSYDYTYILSLRHRQWFKVSRRLWQDEPGSVLVNGKGSTPGTITVFDMGSEVSTAAGGSLLVHLQSRPFSMGYQYCHIHRIVSMVRARIASGHRIAAALYGSDDLQNWKLLAYAKRTGGNDPLFLSQLRTCSSARSWRYYTVCIGGLIPADADFPTDIGPVIVDYQPVTRRIG